MDENKNKIKGFSLEVGFYPGILLGARTSTDLLRLEEFEKYANVYYTTEDGTAGEKGYPTTHSILTSIPPTQSHMDLKS